MNFESFLYELNNRIDMVDLVSSYTRLKKTGRISKGLCPFHHEKTPSFTVYSDTNSFYCFGCGVGGNMITFITLAEGLDFIDALKYLADKAGLEMPNVKVDDGMIKLRTKILEINRVAARFFHSMLHTRSATQALNYLKKRGLTDKVIKNFGLGYAPNSFNALSEYLQKKGYSKEDIERANLANNVNGKLKDRFFNRVIFPIIDSKGSVIAFGARAMGDAVPKYLNTSDTPVFKKSENLFALNFAKNSKKDRFILAEGYMDVIAMHRIGFTETVASLGTSLTSGQARLIARYTKEAVIAYDSDEAGQKATLRAIPLLREAGLAVRVLKLPSGKDPDEFITHTKDADIRIKNLLKDTQGDLDFRINKLKLQHDLNSTQGKVGFINKVCELLSTVENDIERDIYLSKLSNEEKVNKEVLKDQVQKLRMKAQKKNTYKKRSAEVRVATPTVNNNALSWADKRICLMEESLLAYMLRDSEGAEKIISDVYDNYKDLMFNREFFEFIAQRLKENKSFDIVAFSGSFSVEKISLLAKFTATRGNNIRTKEQLYEYIEILCGEYVKKKIKNKGQLLNNADIGDYIEVLKRQRQK